MNDNELILYDRIETIKTVIDKYDGECRFYLSFSGGKDSMILHKLLDLALPGNFIPRVFCDTGIEYNSIRNFVKDLSKDDHRVFIINAGEPIIKMLKTYGYPFKSKEHSATVAEYQKTGFAKQYVCDYVNSEDKYIGCPEKLKYQFTPNFKLKVSDMCCKKLKTEPLRQFQRESRRPYSIVGVRRTEGGRRNHAQCLVFRGNVFKRFQPLAVITDDWEEWFIKEYDIKLCELYYPPYNFQRTGCKGCPFNRRLRYDLQVLHEFFPAEKKQCELIWKPVYDEYRRIGYRLDKSAGNRRLF